MTRYGNGEIPEHLLEELGSGWDQDGQWKHLATPGTAVRWRWMVAAAAQKYGVQLRITPGWNVFRPLRMQFIYRERLGIMAAVPRTSSHGGEYNGRDCMAIDVQNWADLAPGNVDLAWARFVALCRLAGFTTDFVTPRERWHIGDFDPWNVPAWMEDDMFTDDDRKMLREAHEAAMWSKRRIGGSVKGPTIAQMLDRVYAAATWVKKRVGGTTFGNAKTLTDVVDGLGKKPDA